MYDEESRFGNNFPFEQAKQNDASNIATSWGDIDLSIIETDELPPPAFDDQSLPPRWAEWVKAEALSRGTSPDYIAACLLATVSALIGNSRRAQASHNWVEQPHLWFMMVGKPSSGKTPATEPFLEACKALEKQMKPAHEERMADYETKKACAKAKYDQWLEQIEKAVSDGYAAPAMPDDAKTPTPPIAPRVSINDSTIEEICNILSGNPKGLLLFRDELSGWLGSFNRYNSGGGDRAFYLERWNGRSHMVDRAKNSGKPLEVPYASLAILGGIQPDKLRPILSSEDDGLCSRFIFIYPKPAEFQPLQLEAEAGCKERSLFLTKAMTKLNNLTMPQSPEGHEQPCLVPLKNLHRFDEIRKTYHQQVYGSEGLETGWHGKNAGRLLRLALVMEYLQWAADDSSPEPAFITDRAVNQAADYLNYAALMLERVTHGAVRNQQEADAAKLAKHIIANYSLVVNERVVYKTTGMHFLRDAKRRKKAFEHLKKLGWVKEAAALNKGRTRGDWLLHTQIARQ